jgi:alkaline phosphatase D
VSTSITSGLGDYYRKAYEGHRQQNPYVRYFNDRPGGYVRIDLTPQEWQADIKVADSIEDPDSPVRTIASFVVENGQPGAKQA